MKLYVLKPDGSVAAEEYGEEVCRRVLEEAEAWEVDKISTELEVWAITGDESEVTRVTEVKRSLLEAIAAGERFAGFTFKLLDGLVCTNAEAQRHKLLLSEFGGKKGEGFEDSFAVSGRGDGGGGFFVDYDAEFRLVKRW